jgi:hypothetical protein
LQGPATVKVGQAITAEIPKKMEISSAWPLPVSADPETVRLESRTGDGRRERFRALAPGQTMLNVWAARDHEQAAHVFVQPVEQIRVFD